MSLPHPVLPEQEFFNMGEACRLLQIPDYTLRYWESKLRLLRPARRTSGHRRYTRRDLEVVMRVRDLIHDRHLTLTGARKVLLNEARGIDAVTPHPPDVSNGSEPEARTGVSAASLKLLREIRSELRELLTELS